uniref:Uncharacterized protein n=1 Tax=Oikopleura dioica TaxID=34765 RepID=Q675T5_OIKDI|nr:hypothetical protein 005-08 [Oikopleura dioica]
MLTTQNFLVSKIAWNVWTADGRAATRVLKSVFLKTLTVTRAHLLYALSDKAFCLVHYPQRKSLLCPSVPKAALIVPRLNLSNAFNKRISETALTAPLLSSFNIKLVKVNIFQKEGLKRFRRSQGCHKSDECSPCKNALEKAISINKQQFFICSNNALNPRCHIFKHNGVDLPEEQKAKAFYLTKRWFPRTLTEITDGKDENSIRVLTLSLEPGPFLNKYSITGLEGEGERIQEVNKTRDELNLSRKKTYHATSFETADSENSLFGIFRFPFALKSDERLGICKFSKYELTSVISTAQGNYGIELDGEFLANAIPGGLSKDNVIIGAKSQELLLHNRLLNTVQVLKIADNVALLSATQKVKSQFVKHEGGIFNLEKSNEGPWHMSEVNLCPELPGTLNGRVEKCIWCQLQTAGYCHYASHKCAEFITPLSTHSKTTTTNATTTTNMRSTKTTTSEPKTEKSSTIRSTQTTPLRTTATATTQSTTTVTEPVSSSRYLKQSSNSTNVHVNLTTPLSFSSSHTQAHSKYSAREREKGARDKVREHK